MSVTTTDNARITTVRHLLADYDLHHSQPSPAESGEAPEPNAQPDRSTNNPEGWETQWRRVPAYRPVDPALLEGDRNTFNNNIERTFIRVMFGGVYMQALASSIWRSTGGKINDDWFKIKIGGEW